MKVTCICGASVPVSEYHAHVASEAKRDAEISNLEWRVVEAAVKYVKGVGWDAGSLQSEHDALEQFRDNYNAFFEATRALIAARENK